MVMLNHVQSHSNTNKPLAPLPCPQPGSPLWNVQGLGADLVLLGLLAKQPCLAMLRGAHDGGAAQLWQLQGGEGPAQPQAACALAGSHAELLQGQRSARHQAGRITPGCLCTLQMRSLWTLLRRPRQAAWRGWRAMTPAQMRSVPGATAACSNQSGAAARALLLCW